MDLIVFPEGISWEEIKSAQTRHPNGIVVGAVLEPAINSRDCSELPSCRAVALHQGRNRVAYLKVGTDGSMSRGVGHPPAKLPIVHLEGVSIAVLICMDIGMSAWPLRKDVMDVLRSSQANLKMLCVPAAMSTAAGWSDNILQDQMFDGIHVALCNGTRQSNSAAERIKSFITDPVRGTRVQQKGMEAIFLDT